MKVKLINENFQSNYLENLLAARGIKDVEHYIHPTNQNLNDPGLLDNIDNGAILFKKVLEKENSTIFLIVDADVDGYTSAAIIYLFIKSLYPDQKIIYLLHEHKQHGLEDHIKFLLDYNEPCDLVILPDSSSNDYEYHELLKEKNIPCLVLDHHEIDSDCPISNNACIINNQLSTNYSNKALTGAGIVWQFCRYYEYSTFSITSISDSLIDLAALGICGDMGSILDLENRYIMIEGFKEDNIKNYFFKCAIEKQAYSMNNEITPTSVAFYIVPLMNALIRMGTLEEKERLFLGLIDGHRQVPCNKRGAKGTTEEVAVESLRECTNAKAKQNRITDQMVEELEAKIYKYDLLENKILFIRLDDEDDYPSEVVGLCANKIASKYKHPTIIARLNDEGYDRGSIRNVGNCELEDFRGFLNESGYFEYVQGHASAAGCSILDSNLSAFHSYANNALKHIDFNQGVYDVNFIITSEDPALIDLIYDLGSDNSIWGQDNKEPLIYIPNILLDPQEYQIIGTKLDTLKIIINDVVFIKFHATDTIEQLKKCNEIKINLVGKPNINVWMGRKTPQILIEDLEIVDNLLEF